MVPPVPIPNTVVKHVKAESTWLETAREDRKLPVKNTRYTLCVSRIFIWIKASYPTGEPVKKLFFTFLRNFLNFLFNFVNA